MNKKVFLLGFVTITVFPIIAIFIFRYWLEYSICDVFCTKTSYSKEIIIGVLYGAIIGVLALLLIQLPILSSASNKYSLMVKDLELRFIDIVYISVCAGLGEEILFRGAIQPIAGIYITSIVFVAIHGYINPSKGREILLGLYLIFAIIGIGFLSKYVGITSAIIAHSVYDFIIIRRLIK